MAAHANHRRLHRTGRRDAGERSAQSRAVAVSVAIVRAFVELHEMLVGHGQLAGKLAELETKLEGHDDAISNLFEAIRQLIEPPTPSHGRTMGFNQSRD